MRKFKVNDVVQSKADETFFFKIRAVYKDCYDAADCDKNGKLTGGSIDIWYNNGYADEGYAVENDFVKVG